MIETDTPNRLQRLINAEVLVKRQAEDEALWCETESIHEAFLQQELRHLHAVIEGAPLDWKQPRNKDS